MLVEPSEKAKFVPMIGLIKLFKGYRDATTLADREGYGNAIVQLARPHLWSYVRSRTSQEAAEDVLQEVWAGIFKSIGRFRGSTDNEAIGFCFFIARHKAADFVRRSVRNLESPFDLEELELAAAASLESDPLKPGEREDWDAVIGLLAAAKPPCVNYLNDRYIEGLSFEEMGAKYEMTKDGIRMRTERCLELAQTLLAKKEKYA